MAVCRWVFRAGGELPGRRSGRNPSQSGRWMQMSWRCWTLEDDLLRAVRGDESRGPSSGATARAVGEAVFDAVSEPALRGFYWVDVLVGALAVGIVTVAQDAGVALGVRAIRRLLRAQSGGTGAACRRLSWNSVRGDGRRLGVTVVSRPAGQQWVRMIRATDGEWLPALRGAADLAAVAATDSDALAAALAEAATRRACLSRSYISTATDASTNGGGAGFPGAKWRAGIRASVTGGEGTRGARRRQGGPRVPVRCAVGKEDPGGSGS